MARSEPPVPFLADFAIPQPASKQGTHLARRLGKSRSSYGSKWTILSILLVVLFAIPFAMLVVMVAGIAIAAFPIVMVIPSARRKTIGKFISWLKPVEVELSADPLVPGQPFDGVLRFKRPVAPESITISLRCIETAKYRQGTDTHTQRHTAFESVLLETELQRDASAAQTIANQSSIVFAGVVPENAMHCFQGTNNSIDWSIVVTRVFAGGNNADTTFMVDVLTHELVQAIAQFRAMRGGASNTGPGSSGGNASGSMFANRGGDL